MSPLKINEQLAKTIEGGMNMKGAGELPFPAPVLWVVNGNAKAAAAEGALHFGGWASDAETLASLIDQKQITSIEECKFHLGSMVTNEGKEISLFTNRSVIVAPVRMRKCWVTQDGVRLSEFEAGARQHIQVLAVMAKAGPKATDPFSMWGPVVLSAKGFQARNLQSCFSTWNKYTAALRTSLAPGVPAWLFYVAIGTFGDKREAVMVGKGSKSPITPIVPFLPPSLDEKTLTRLFGGDPLAEKLGTMLKESDDWAKLWEMPAQDTFKSGKEAGGHINMGMETYDESEAPVEGTDPF
jgi:hypothetical protein